MAQSSFQNILPVNWFDGLLVSSRHLSHSDERVDALLAYAATSMMEQPGLTGDGPDGVTAHQLINIESQSSTEVGIELQISISRQFQALSPAGFLIIGIPNKNTRIGIPSTTLSAKLEKGADSEYLVCVRQGSREDLHVQVKGPDDLDNIELKYPSLEVAIIDPQAYLHGLRGQNSFFVPIGRIGVIDKKVVVDSEYIPPICRLELTASYDAGLLSSLTSHFQELQRNVYNLVQSAVLASVEGDLGTDFLSRRADYEALNSFLLGKLGLIRTLGRISPYRLLFEIVYPLVSWWNTYHDRQFQPGSNSANAVMPKASILANQILAIDFMHLCSESSQCLYRTREFLEALNSELGVLG